MHGDDSDKVDAEDDRVFVKNGKKDGLRKVFRVGIVSVLVVALVAFGVVKLINGGFDALMKQVGWVQDEIRKDDPQYKINSVTVGTNIVWKTIGQGLLDYWTVDGSVSDKMRERWNSIISVNYLLVDVPVDYGYSQGSEEKTGVALWVEVDNSRNDYIAVDTSKLLLIGGGESMRRNEEPFRDFIAKNDLNILEVTKKNGFEDGWLFFYVRNDFVDELILRYARSEFSVNNDGVAAQVPAKNLDLYLY